MKQVMTSKILRKLTLLSCLIVGLLTIELTNHPVEAASDCQDYYRCSNEAYQAREDCYAMCGGIISCENSVCNPRFDDDVAQCDAAYPDCF